MTVDERLEFLLQSAESLHQTVQELSGTVHELSGTVHKLSGTVETLVGAVAADGEHIRGLVRIAELHHQRLTLLEGESDGESDENLPGNPG